jgi:hypothetical protein
MRRVKRTIRVQACDVILALAPPTQWIEPQLCKLKSRSGTNGLASASIRGSPAAAPLSQNRYIDALVARSGGAAELQCIVYNPVELSNRWSAGVDPGAEVGPISLSRQNARRPCLNSSRTPASASDWRTSSVPPAWRKCAGRPCENLRAQYLVP